MATLNWHTLKKTDVFEALKTSAAGLTTDESRKRLATYGKNRLPHPKLDSPIKIFFRQLIEPMEILLLFAMVVSFAIGEIIDGSAICFIILADVLMGTVQEWKAGKTAEALQDLICVDTKVLRDGTELELDAELLVPGDIVHLESGDKIAADLRIIECSNLQIDESVLTGESLPVTKSPKICPEKTPLAGRHNMAFAGTSILTGRATAIVVSTGINTEVGKIADKVANTKEEKSPLSIRMEKFTRQITTLIVVIAVLLTAVLGIKGTPISEIFLSVIALSVSAMPEGLGLALTMALTIAANRMSKKKVIVKRLNAVESLGSCTVIASDKTGTLTVNEQTAKRIILPNDSIFEIDGTGYNDNGDIRPARGNYTPSAIYLSKMGALNNEAKFEKTARGFKHFGDSIDIAFLVLGAKLKVNTSGCEIIATTPYESEKKYSSVTFQENNQTIYTIKGSLEIVLSRCNCALINGEKIPLDKERIITQNEALAKDGYRVIALADKIVKPGEKIHEDKFTDLRFLGLVAFIDPVREEVKSSIRECKTAGIKVLMITGDHPLTAFSIAKELNLATNFEQVATGQEVDEHLALGEQAFDEFIKSKTIYTRVTPLNKLEIVESLKRQGEFVAVTGDGVNDAPAIKSANIGIAMGSGTDVAKETASLIILDNNFKSIVAGIKEGRNAYANIRKVSFMLLSCGIAEVLFFLLSVLCDMPMPLVAIQLLWLNMVTDGLQDLALSFEQAERGIMKEPPRNPKESIFNWELFSEIIVSGFAIGIIVFFVWVFLVRVANIDIPLARGYIMALMVFMQNMHVLNCRSERESILTGKIKPNKFVFFSIGSAIFLQILVMEVPLFSQFLQTSSIPPGHILGLFGISTIILVIGEVYKKIHKNITDK